MTNNSSPIFALIAQQIVDAYRPMVKAAGEVLRKVAEVLDKVRETYEETQEREKQRAYEHLVLPPHDHTRARVAHTSSKPPHPHRTYRRRTP